MKRLLPLVVAGMTLLTGVPELRAETVVLHPGESHRQGDLNVTCVERRVARPLVLTDCQHWDDFDKRCLYERKVHSVGRLSCVEECQHWDDFNNVCEYASTCVFYPEHALFVRTTCEEFDSTSRRCLRQKEAKIAPR